MIEPATSPSEMRRMRAPVWRTSSMIRWCRGRSKIITVTSSGVSFLACATRSMFSATDSVMSTASAASGPVTSFSM
jgi:hypothetical protein